MPRTFDDFRDEIDGLLATGTSPAEMADWFSTEDLEEFLTAYAVNRLKLRTEEESDETD